MKGSITCRFALKKKADNKAVLLTAENDERIQLTAVMASGDLLLAGDGSQGSLRYEPEMFPDC
ncbi:hypothetical protein BTA30_20415 [Bacillus swezeyi]|uniref:Uncharacterized protein n=1 Tax=Bacillus swezeyi TaxID=1925020 RepID=A0A1R1RIR0_9BACI|nr:hypothetical protein BW143_00645 [Bacillus swezeyi]OMI25888.1 hypothetical protein BTA30_20415 [Bacillus swezeyi]